MSEATLLDKLLSELESMDAPDEVDLMLRDHPGKRITIAHIARARSAAERYLLIAWRFPWLYKSKEEQAGKAPDTLEDIRKLEKNLLATTGEGEAVVTVSHLPLGGAGGGQRAVDPLEADLAKLRALPREQLTHRNGLVNKSAVARALGYSTGGGNWDYVGEVSAHYQAELDEADQLAGDTEETESSPKQEAA